MRRRVITGRALFLGPLGSGGSFSSEAMSSITLAHTENSRDFQKLCNRGDVDPGTYTISPHVLRALQLTFIVSFSQLQCPCSALEIVVDLQCQVDIIEQATPPVVHDHRTGTVRLNDLTHVRGENKGPVGSFFKQLFV